LAKAGDKEHEMKFVYTIQSLSSPDEFYTGITYDLQSRLAEHNRGESSHTCKFMPWKIVTYTAFVDEQKAHDFERYLKTGSGRAFAKKRLRS